MATAFRLVVSQQAQCSELAAGKGSMGAPNAHIVDVTSGTACLSQICTHEAGWAETGMHVIISRPSGSFEASFWLEIGRLAGGLLVLAAWPIRADGGSQFLWG